MDKKIERKKFSLVKGIIYLGGIAVLLFFISSAYNDLGSSTLKVESERLITDTVSNGLFQEFITISGVVQPIKTVYVSAIEGGRVEEIFVEDGTYLKKEQPILQLSNSDLQASYLNQETNIVAQINQIRNTTILMEQQRIDRQERAADVLYRLDQLEKSLKRNEILYRDSVISQVDYEKEQDEYKNLQRRKILLYKSMESDSLFQDAQAKQMESTLTLMRRNLDISKSSLDRLTVRAPINGQLSALDVEIGELIAKGDKIAQVDILEKYKIRAKIDEFYVSRVFLDQEGTFTFDGDSYRLKVKKIYPDVVNGSFEVDLVFQEDPPTSIKRGQTVTIRLALSSETHALLLERGGFYQNSGGNWAYVIDPATGHAFKKNIKVGRQNPSYYEVLEGLREGDVVITSSYDNYNEMDELVLR